MKKSAVSSQQSAVRDADDQPNAVIFWDTKGEEILRIVGGVGSAVLLEIFDTLPNRGRILALTGRLVDNTSEDYDPF